MEEKSPAIRWDISVGNLMNLAALGVTVAVAWGVMTERSEATHKNLDTLRVAQDDIENRVRQLETGQARSSEKLDNIMKSLERIEGFMEKRR